MALTFTWTGGSGNWFTPSNWQPNGPPAAGSVALIDVVGGPTIDAGSPGVDDVIIQFETRDAALGLNGGTLGARATLVSDALHVLLDINQSSEFDGIAGFGSNVTGGQLDIHGVVGETLTIGQTSTITVGTGNTVASSVGTVSNDGTIVVAGGSLMLDSGSISGTGTIAIRNGGLLYSNDEIGPGETIDFLDQTGHLQLFQSGAIIAGPIVNFQAGDDIWLPQHGADAVSYDAATRTLRVTDVGTIVAQFSLTTNGAPITFGLRQGPFGPVIVSSEATRVWNGGTADWYAAGNWATTPPAPAGFPLAGDTVRIGSGLVTITAADVTQYGTIDAETIILSGTTGAPGGLEITHDAIGPNATIETTGKKQFGLLEIRGNDTLFGEVYSGAHTGRLTLDFDNGATLTNVDGNLLAGSSASLVLDGTGSFLNDGAVVVEGALSIGAGVTVSNFGTAWGTIRLQQGGQLTTDGLFLSNGILFGDSSGLVTIDNLPNFFGALWNMTSGDRIDLANTIITAVTYDAGSSSLELFSGTTDVGALIVTTIDGFNGFSVKSDGHGGSLITYQPTDQVLQPALPVPLVAAPGQSVALQDLLIQAFGTLPAAYTQSNLGLSYGTQADLSQWNYSYWDLANQAVSNWQVGGTVVGAMASSDLMPPNPPIDLEFGSGLAGVTLQAGTQIMPNAFLQIPIGPLSQVAYWIETVDPHVASPTIYSGHVDPVDIVQSALRFDAFYGFVVNDNDCGWIADDLAAAAGATMPNNDQSLDPSANVAGGFWRVVYRGSDQSNPVADWGTLVQAGDVVRMGWKGGGGHTTTVLAVNADGSILAYDNDNNGGIGIHDATYWNDTIPDTITIYRLDPNHQYLVQGTGQTEFLQGSPYNNLIEPNGGADTIAAGAGTNEIQGSVADLNSIKVMDWHQGDTLDLTDMPFAGASVHYDASAGLLLVQNTAIEQAVSVTLPSGLVDQFLLAPNGSGTDVTMACFADGTRLRTPDGEVAVEDLRVGDVLLTVSDPRRPSRVVRWIGWRKVDLRRHPDPRKLRPVRIAAHAFGPGLPTRPLYLSPDHAIYHDGVLIPVRYLIDGKAVRQVAASNVTYWHVELDRHDAVLAEGLPAESFLDTGQRHAFENGGPVVMFDPDFCWWVREAQGCAPLVVTGPPVERALALLRTAAPSRSRRGARG